MTSAPAADAGTVGPPAPTVTLDVWRLRPADAVRAMLATPTWTHRAASGISFTRLLGTGGTSFAPGAADLTRWIAVTVWRSGSTGVTSPAWARHAVDHFQARLAPLSARGAWAGRSPFAAAGREVATAWQGEVLALTRARLRPGRTLRFWRSVGPVAHAVPAADGLQAAMAMGEAPVGFQGTVSLWRDAAAVSAFAWRDPAHRAVVDRTPREHWYAEELFARFAVVERTSSLALWADRLAADPGRAA